MLLHIPGLFSREEVQRIRQALETADWADGRITAGHQSAKAKHNLQLPEGHPLAKEIGTAMLERLWQNPLFMSAALPHKVFPPLLNCYTAGGSFDFHIDNAVRQPKGSQERVRTDLSSTLFFSDRRTMTARTGDPGHLRRATGQAARRRYGAVPRLQPA